MLRLALAEEPRREGLAMAMKVGLLEAAASESGSHQLADKRKEEHESFSTVHRCSTTRWCSSRPGTNCPTKRGGAPSASELLPIPERERYLAYLRHRGWNRSNRTILSRSG